VIYKTNVVFRVAHLGNDQVQVDCVGLECNEWKSLSNKRLDSSELPMWMQNKLAVLMHRRRGEKLAGIGRRVSENVFWVYLDNVESDDGDDPREESKTTSS